MLSICLRQESQAGMSSNGNYFLKCSINTKQIIEANYRSNAKNTRL